MKTKLITGHEEEYKTSTSRKTLGMLVMLNVENNNRVDSLSYIYSDGKYIFFNTIIEMCDFLLYGNEKTKRAYMKEDDFDLYYDMPYIDGLFTDKLKWLP